KGTAARQEVPGKLPPVGLHAWGRSGYNHGGLPNEPSLCGDLRDPGRSRDRSAARQPRRGDMSEAPSTDNESLPLSAARQGDAVCFRFERAWKAGQRPQVEDYLADVPEPARPALLRELIALDADYRRRAGEEPRPEDYQARFPGFDPAWVVRTV